MKKIAILLLCAGLTASCASLNTSYLLQSGMTALQAVTLTDAQIQDYVHQYITQLDAQSVVLGANDPYTKRLRNLTSRLTEVDGVPLNFKVYKTSEVNAFACADGSVRVYSGIMDLMTDQELIGIIGHEIGHVALKHSKKEMQAALLTDAAFTGLAATHQTVAALTQSQLGALGETIIGAQYSKKQELQADDFAYDFLRGAQIHPSCLVAAFKKLQNLERSEATSTAVMKLV